MTCHFFSPGSLLSFRVSMFSCCFKECSGSWWEAGADGGVMVMVAVMVALMVG